MVVEGDTQVVLPGVARARAAAVAEMGGEGNVSPHESEVGLGDPAVVVGEAAGVLPGLEMGPEDPVVKKHAIMREGDADEPASGNDGDEHGVTGKVVALAGGVESLEEGAPMLRSRDRRRRTPGPPRRPAGLHAARRVASHARSDGPKGTMVTDPSHRPKVSVRPAAS